MATPQTARFSNLLRRMMLVRESAPADLIGDFFPMLDLLASRPEMYLHRRELPFGFIMNAAAVAGNVGRLWLMNKKPNCLAVVDSVIAFTQGGVALPVSYLAITNAGLPADNLGTGLGTDTRAASPVAGFIPTMVTGAVDTTQPGPLAPAVIHFGIPATGSVIVPCRVVLSTGWALVLSGGIQNTAVSVSFQGYERAVEDIGELQP